MMANASWRLPPPPKEKLRHRIRRTWRSYWPFIKLAIWRRLPERFRWHRPTQAEVIQEWSSGSKHK